ncbi:hypothetical protein NMY22_g10696 [Coprinellus aureogranulatus]|nr:hypothetical protein NMY22_g10696 [Coprinellus aureogranulatus]
MCPNESSAADYRYSILPASESKSPFQYQLKLGPYGASRVSEIIMLIDNSAANRTSTIPTLDNQPLISMPSGTSLGYDLQDGFLTLCESSSRHQYNGFSFISDTQREELHDRYHAVIRDFCGSPSRPPCIYKSGPAWREMRGAGSWPVYRETRAVHDHPISNTWIEIGTRIYKHLDSKRVMWTSIDPVAFAEQDEPKPFCPLIMWIGVEPNSLAFEDAVVAADGVKDILDEEGFPEIEVAFRMSIVTRSGSGPDHRAPLCPVGPQLLNLDDRFLDAIPEFYKPFTPVLGLPIASYDTPCREGTGALYFRLGRDSTRIVLLTTAHTVRNEYTFPHYYPVEYGKPFATKIVAPGCKAYDHAIVNMMDEINSCMFTVDRCSSQIARLPRPLQEREQRRADSLNSELGTANAKIESISELHSEVTRLRTTFGQRTVGFLLHTDPIASGDAPHCYTNDWALIELYPEKFDTVSFPGNKVFLGNFSDSAIGLDCARSGTLSFADYNKLMFPRPDDNEDWRLTRDGLLPATGTVTHEEIRSPKYLGKDGSKCLMVVKNGMATGTTAGQVNGLESFTRIRSQDDTEHTSIEVAVLPPNGSRSTPHFMFSAPGDSGAIALDRKGGIVGMITSGTGKGDIFDITYLTPYWWLEKKIKEVFPDSCLYEPSTSPCW